MNIDYPSASTLADWTRPHWDEQWFEECGVRWNAGGLWLLTADACMYSQHCHAENRITYALIFTAAVEALPEGLRHGWWFAYYTVTSDGNIIGADPSPPSFVPPPSPRRNPANDRHQMDCGGCPRTASPDQVRKGGRSRGPQLPQYSP